MALAENPDTNPPQMPPGAALLQATIRDLAPAIVAADRLGVEDSRHDLYWLIDYLGFAVDQAYPQIPCANGCDACCRNQVFRVTALEWQVAKRGLDALPAEKRTAIYARAREVFGPYRAQLDGLSAAWTAGERADPDLHREAPKTCPALIDGKCSIYADRPAICRAYGYMSAVVDGTGSLLICRQYGPDWIRTLEAMGVENLPMPSWNPIQRQLETLNAGVPIKPLPLWLMEDAVE